MYDGRIVERKRMRDTSLKIREGSGLIVRHLLKCQLVCFLQLSGTNLRLLKLNSKIMNSMFCMLIDFFPRGF